MGRMRYVQYVVLAAIVLLTLPIGAADTLTAGEDVVLGLGDTRTGYVTLTNEKDEPDTYIVTVQPSMTPGYFTANFSGADSESGETQVRIGANTARDIKVTYTAAYCPDSVCTGTATFLSESLETDRRQSADIGVTINRDESVYGAPGITLVEVLVLVLAAATVFAIGRD